MNIAQLTKALKHEARTRPLKVGVLALLLIVAMYFWIPLAGNLLGLGQSGVPQPAVTIPEPQSLVATLPEAASQPAAAELSWQQLHSARVADPLSHPVELQHWNKDPFVVPDRPEQTASSGDEQSPRVSKAPTAEELGLQLSGVIAGTNSRLAMINGRSYRPQDAIELSNGDSAIVQEIHNRHVVLRYQAYEIELIIPKPFER